MFLQKRLKLKKRKQNVQKKTVDQSHQYQVDEYNERKKERHMYISEIEKYKSELRENTCKDDIEDDIEDNIEDKIQDLTGKINKCIEMENEYYIQNAHLLFDYYDMKNQEGVAVGNTQKSKNSVLSFFVNNDEHCDDDEREDENKLKDIIKSYRRQTQPNQQVLTQSNNYIEECRQCKCHKILVNNDSTLLCPKCGEESEIILNRDKPSYKEPPKEYTHFAYKRINHFNEWLSQFQAKESTFISPDIILKIKNEIKKERLTRAGADTLPVKKIRGYLKKLGLNKYYEHIPHIITRITGKPPPIIPRKKEEMLRTMFRQIQTPFFNHVPKKRKNFLSYSYVLHKFTELLNMDELSSCFPLLKSRSKLYQQDLIWKNICKDLNWQFIRSI